MSLILDALNKSEQERPESSATPGLQTMHETGEATRSHRWKGFVWPVAAVIFAVAVWLTRPPQAPVLAPVTEQIPQPQTMPVVAVSQVAPQVAQPELQVDEPQKTPVNGGVADLYASTPALAPASAPIVAAAATEPEPERATPPAEPIAALDVNAMTRAAEEALAERPVVHHAIPLIGDLNQNAKDEIPSLFFTSHRWDSLAGDREVVINGNTYREGDLVKPGLRLTEILEDSIVLDYRGTQFRLGSLNSWVNL